MTTTYTIDMHKIFDNINLSKRGRISAVVYKKTRDMMLESIVKQFGIFNIFREGSYPKHEWYNENKMFYEYSVEICGENHIQ